MRRATGLAGPRSCFCCRLFSDLLYRVSYKQQWMRSAQNIWVSNSAFSTLQNMAGNIRTAKSRRRQQNSSLSGVLCKGCEWFDKVRLFPDLAVVRVCCQELIEDLRCDCQRACYITPKTCYVLFCFKPCHHFPFHFLFGKGKAACSGAARNVYI